MTTARPHAGSEKFLEGVAIQGFGCIRSVTLGGLRPLNALIGPNDSGKSMILRAIHTAYQFGGGTFQRTRGPSTRGTPPWSPFDPMVERLWPNGSIRISYSKGFAYEIAAQTSGGKAELKESARSSTAEFSEAGRALNSPSFFMVPSDSTAPGEVAARREVREFFTTTLRRPPVIRLYPEALRRPSKLIPSHEPLAVLNDGNIGLAAIYDAISNRNIDGVLAIREGVRRLFPTIKNVTLRNVTESEKQLEIELLDGQRVPADLMSEGLLYYLAFAALPHLESTALLLIEEPENGLHPARLVEVVRLLREISLRTQVILTTHSPLVVNELEPDEVRVVTRDVASGTQVTPMKETSNFGQRFDVYALGELWLNYSDGNQEQPLIAGGTPP